MNVSKVQPETEETVKDKRLEVEHSPGPTAPPVSHSRD